MGLYELLTEYAEIVELLDCIEARELLIQASITAIDAMCLIDADREARLAPLREDHARLCAELDEAVSRVARL